MPYAMRKLLVGVALVLLSLLIVDRIELAPSLLLTRRLSAQDVPANVLIALLLFGLAAWPRQPPICGRPTRIAASERRIGVALTLLAALAAGFGTRYVALYTPISHDEIMTSFDAEIVRNGQMMAPIPPEWRSLSWALEPAFRLPVPGDAAWVSTYLPGNAVIRGLLAHLFGPAATNAVLVGIAMLGLWQAARVLWPSRHDAVVIAVILGATSAQVLCMGMTPYAMTAHLALNLIWLCLYLRKSAWGHAGALGVGFIATGLHQLIFHPLFVAPFICQLLLDRRWRLAAIYVAGYALISLFWTSYWQFLLNVHGVEGRAASAVGVSFLLLRIRDMLADFSWWGLQTMLQNLLRFVSWQNPLLLVLIVPGAVVAWRQGGVLRSLAAGLGLTVFAMFVLLPYQDIGWGYRYLHGLIGSASLLAAAGWVELTGQDAQPLRRTLRAMATVCTIATIVVLLPLRFSQMHAYLAPYSRAWAAIERNSAEAVVIETISIDHGVELVRNDPYLRNRPLMFDIGLLDEAQIAELCRRMTAVVFDGSQAAVYGITALDPTKHPAYERLRHLRGLLEGPGCKRPT